MNSNLNNNNLRLLLLLLLPLLLLYQGAAGGNKFHIKNEEEFINFSASIDSGMNYFGTTVFLDNDIDLLNSQLEPIGKASGVFMGTFDGLGNMISRLAINSTSQYAGLFGQSNRATFRNVVMPDSFSVTSSYTGNEVSYVGGIVGYCDANIRACTIENSLNMGTVSFTGSTTNELYIGGIIGIFVFTSGSSTGRAFVMNCANFNTVKYNTTNAVFAGGIVGSVKTVEGNIQNCINYGTIDCGLKTSGSYVGGILGGLNSGSVNIENCVSVGKINITTVNGGSIAGYAYSSAMSIKHCYWANDVGNYDACGSGGPTIDNETTQASLNTTAVENLNSYNSSWNKWLLNTNKKSISLKINSGSGLILSHQLILLPSLVESENYTFSGWFEDEDYTKELTNSSVDAEIVLYGGWKITMTFDFGNGTTTQKGAVCGQKYGELPSATRTGYTFVGWFTEKNVGNRISTTTPISSTSSHTLYAHWTVNSYTVTLNVNGGDALPASEIIVTYDQPYNCLPSPSRTGYTFIGWYTEENEGIEITNKTTASITADNHTLYAQWIINNYTLTFDFGNETVVNKILKYNDTIVYPVNLTRGGYTFSEWKPKPKRMPANDTTVVAHWTANNYTVTLNVNGGDALAVNEFTVTYDQPYNCLPNAIRTGHTFIGWYTEENGGIKVTNKTIANITAGNHTLRAHWTTNNYTLTFDFGNGTVVNKILTYNETIDYPENLTREECVFSEWKPKPERMPANDTTVVAQWIENATSEFIKIVFEAKDLTIDEIEDFIKSLTDEEFKIVEYEEGKNTGSVTVIAKFNNAEAASGFVEAINGYARDTSAFPNVIIRNVSFISEHSQSFSSRICPFLLSILVSLSL